MGDIARLVVAAAIAGFLPGCSNAREEAQQQNAVHTADTTTPRAAARGTMNWNDVLRLARNGSPAPDRRVEKTDEEWRALLTPEQFIVTRRKGTERPFSGEYCESHEPGLYACVCCRTVLFDSRRKFDSGTGWPSFTEPAAPNVIRYEADLSLGMERVEVMCSVCDAHLGHVFPDGPGGRLRFCINSASLIRVSEGKDAR